MGIQKWGKYEKGLDMFGNNIKHQRSRYTSFSSSLNRMHRESEKQRRLLQKELKENRKLLEKDAAALEVQAFELQIAVLKSVHKEIPNVWEWDKIINQPSPVKPTETYHNEERAINDYNNYVPSLIDKIFFRTKSKLNKLKENIEIEKKKDKKINTDRIETYNNLLSEYEGNVELAKKILNGDLEAYFEAIYAADPFNDIYDIGSVIKVNLIDKYTTYVDFFSNIHQIVPSEKKTLTKTGKVSVKNMPKKEYYELYQDYVCGCTLRIGRELFALLPLNLIIITAHSEELPILSVALERDIFLKLNFEMLYPSDSLVNFKHNMKFKKTEGFFPIEPLNIPDL